jgi:hypothetical protein
VPDADADDEPPEQARRKSYRAPKRKITTLAHLNVFV